MALKAGKITRDPITDNITEDLAGSMAAAIMKAFKDEWRVVMKDTKTPEAPVFTPQTELLFVAVAQGVVNHLAAHPEAFKINVNATNVGTGTHSHTASVSSIQKQ